MRHFRILEVKEVSENGVIVKYIDSLERDKRDKYKTAVRKLRHNNFRQAYIILSGREVLLNNFLSNN